MHKNINY